VAVRRALDGGQRDDHFSKIVPVRAGSAFLTDEMRACLFEWFLGVCALEHLRAHNLLKIAAARSRKDGRKCL
jgi:hypothetical protein